MVNILLLCNAALLILLLLKRTNTSDQNPNLDSYFTLTDITITSSVRSVTICIFGINIYLNLMVAMLYYAPRKTRRNQFKVFDVKKD